MACLQLSGLLMGLGKGLACSHLLSSSERVSVRLERWIFAEPPGEVMSVCKVQEFYEARVVSMGRGGKYGPFNPTGARYRGHGSTHVCWFSLTWAACHLCAHAARCYSAQAIMAALVSAKVV